MDMRLKKVEKELNKYIDDPERINFILHTGTPDELLKIVELDCVKDLIDTFSKECVKTHYVRQEDNVHFIIDKKAKDHPNLERLIKAIVKDCEDFENPVYIDIDDKNPEGLLIE